MLIYKGNDLKTYYHIYVSCFSSVGRASDCSSYQISDCHRFDSDKQDSVKVEF